MTDPTLENPLLDPTRDDHFVRTGDSVHAGTHLIIDVIGGKNLDCAQTVETAIRASVEACGATLIHVHLHRFSPLGVSGVAVLAESHISVHTWPEAGYAAFDVFMCGDTKPWNAVDILREAFSAEDVRVQEIRRGEGIV